MKRSFVKLAKKNPKFWEIEIDGKSYTITEGETDLTSQTTTKEFSDANKCLKAAIKLIEKTRESGYKETLPEYSEWTDEKNDHAIWRNREAVEFIVKTLKENSTHDGAEKRDPETAIKKADETLDEILAHTDELEIYIAKEFVKIRMMALAKDPYQVELLLSPVFTLLAAKTPYWSKLWESIVYTPNDKFKDLIVDFLCKHGHGKWFGRGESQDKSVAKEALESEERKSYLRKLRSVVDEQYAQPRGPVLAIALSRLEMKPHFYDRDEIAKDIPTIIFKSAKSKAKDDFEGTLRKTCYMLHDVEKQLPFARVRQALDDQVKGEDVAVDDLYRDMVFEEWEKNPESSEWREFIGSAYKGY